MTDTKPKTEAEPMYFFMATALAIYQTDDGIKQRHVNVLLECVTPQLAKKELQQISRSVIARINAENKVAPDQVKDIIMMNILPLGHMSPEEFHRELPLSSDFSTN